MLGAEHCCEYYVTFWNRVKEVSLQERATTLLVTEYKYGTITKTHGSTVSLPCYTATQSYSYSMHPTIQLLNV